MMIVRPYHTVPLLVASFVACVRGRAPDIRSDSYAVYAAALDSSALASIGVRSVDPRSWRVSLSDNLSDSSRILRQIQTDTSIGRQLVAEFDSLNATSVTLCNCFPGEKRLTLVPDTLGPKKVVRFVLSRVAFTPDRKRALVAIQLASESEVVAWGLYLVIREADRWRVSRTLTTILHMAATGTTWRRS